MSGSCCLVLLPGLRYTVSDPETACVTLFTGLAILKLHTKALGHLYPKSGNNSEYPVI